MWDAVVFIIACLAVIAGAYYTTYFIAKRNRAAQTKKYGGRAVRLRESFVLSKDRQVAVFQICEKVYIVAFSGGGAALLDSMDAVEYDERAGSREEPRPTWKRAGGALAEWMGIGGREKRSIKTGREEDGLDEMYRKARQRKTDRERHDEEDR